MTILKAEKEVAKMDSEVPLAKDKHSLQYQLQGHLYYQYFIVSLDKISPQN
jgi:hypothetical protein